MSIIGEPSIPSAQWTVGQLRAELVGLPDSTPLVVDVPASSGAVRRLPIVGAGYGAGIDPDEGIFVGQEFPLTAGDPRTCDLDASEG